ncbi:MAG: NMD3-related protein [Nanoarchaeota archaeon]
MHNEYFEGILQLRAPTEEVLSFIESEMLKHGKVRVSKTKQVADGADMYMTDQRFLQNLGRRLKDRFGGQLKVAPRLFSKDHLTSKNVYRVNVLFRMPAFARGDEMTVIGRRVKVLAVKKLVQVQDLENGEKFAVPFEKVEAAAKKD